MSWMIWSTDWLHIWVCITCVHRLSICTTPKIYSSLLSMGLNKIVFLNLVKNGVFYFENQPFFPCCSINFVLHVMGSVNNTHLGPKTKEISLFSTTYFLFVSNEIVRWKIVPKPNLSLQYVPSRVQDFSNSQESLQTLFRLYRFTF